MRTTQSADSIHACVAINRSAFFKHFTPMQHYRYMTASLHGHARHTLNKLRYSIIATDIRYVCIKTDTIHQVYVRLLHHHPVWYTGSI